MTRSCSSLRFTHDDPVRADELAVRETVDLPVGGALVQPPREEQLRRGSASPSKAKARLKQDCAAAFAKRSRACRPACSKQVMASTVASLRPKRSLKKPMMMPPNIIPNK